MCSLQSFDSALPGQKQNEKNTLKESTDFQLRNK